MSPKRARNATAIVTGGAKRIGKSIAIHLASLGYDIALHYNQSTRLAEQTAALITKTGRRCIIFPCNLTRNTDTEKLFSDIKQELPNIALLINNASIFEKSNLTAAAFKNLERDFTANFYAPYLLIQAFARQCKTGQVINILDTNVVKNKTMYSNYLLSKKALLNYTQMAAVELAPAIRVNALAPGLILPPENKNNDYLNRLAKKIPLKKKGNPKNVLQTIDFFLQNDYVTGQTIFVDGGEHLL